MTAQHVFVTRDADGTRGLGAALGRRLGPGAVVLLRGDLGAGKTTFVQGLARGLGVADAVISPTFVLVREHAVGADDPRPAGPPATRLVHADLYRLRGAADAAALGLDDHLAAGDIVVVEWPERAPGLWPDDAIAVALEGAPREGRAGPGLAALDAPEPRRLTFTAHTPAGAALLAALAADAARLPGVRIEGGAPDPAPAGPDGRP